jgi:hypothetical protein
MRLLEQSQDRSFTIHPVVRDGFLQGLRPKVILAGHDAVRLSLNAALGERPGTDIPVPDQLDLVEEVGYHTLAAGHVEEAFRLAMDRIHPGILPLSGQAERGERICRSMLDGVPPQLSQKPPSISTDLWRNFLYG